jgi:hypothetical protein
VPTETTNERFEGGDVVGLGGQRRRRIRNIHGCFVSGLRHGSPRLVESSSTGQGVSPRFTIR